MLNVVCDVVGFGLEIGLFEPWVMGNKNKKMEKKKVMCSKTMVIPGLGVLLVGALGYIGIGKYNEVKQQEQLQVFQQGAIYGYEEAVVSIMNVASGCSKVPLRNGNVTMDVVAVECLSQGGQE